MRFINVNLRGRTSHSAAKKLCLGGIRTLARCLYEIFLPLRTSLKGGWHDEGSNLRCHCFGALANPESLTPSKWVPVIDQVLLTVSIVLAYMVDGSKLIDGLKATENDDYLDRSVNDRDITNGSLSLFAVAESPRLRLLWITLQRLHNEAGIVSTAYFLSSIVINTSQSYEGISRDGWSAVSYQILQQIIQPICIEWFEGELSLKIAKRTCILFISTGAPHRNIQEAVEDNSVLDSFKGLGKSELYADLLYSFDLVLYVMFTMLSLFDSYQNVVMGISSEQFPGVEHGVDILEDLVVSLADGISSMYLELISIDSNVADEMNSLDLNLCRLSTRELQRIRNEVALRQWVLRNFQSGRLDRGRPGNHWWQKFAYGKAESNAPLLRGIDRAPMRVKRTKELRALTGWRYYFSLFLELSDVAMPLFRVVFTKGREVVSFLLTCLVGRSLGLIYAGIRQSLGFPVKRMWGQFFSLSGNHFDALVLHPRH
ncbi:unnamed protein product [Spirodela intermedia]|uniref:Uncharacterized protein n=1 Tax=Spirodela intermedia TaxID=51605 RepID=A0ABN7EC78_SPIIN|nr:unnamed protein product [Spirodela intermedia]